MSASLATLVLLLGSPALPIEQEEAPSIATEVLALPAGGDGPAVPLRAAKPGDVVLLRIDWPGPRPGTFAVADPDDGDGLGNHSVRRVVRSDPRAEGADVVELLVFGLGTIEIGPLDIVDADGESIGRTMPAMIEVVAGLDESDSEPSPERPAMTLGLDRAGMAIALLATTLALGAAAWLLARLMRRRIGPSELRERIVPVEHPAERALRELDELSGSGLAARGSVKRFCIRLAEIGKTFEGGVSRAALMELTTSECGRELRRRGMDERRVAWFTGWLDRIDLVKFAGDRPEHDALDDLVTTLRTVVVRELPHEVTTAERGAP